MLGNPHLDFSSMGPSLLTQKALAIIDTNSHVLCFVCIMNVGHVYKQYLKKLKKNRLFEFVLLFVSNMSVTPKIELRI